MAEHHYQNLKTAMATLQIKIRALMEEIADSRVRNCTVFSYPRISKLEESEEYRHIPVSRVDGDEALAQALTSFMRFSGDGTESTKAVFRLPGVINVDTPYPDTLKNLVMEVNQAKVDFQSAARDVPELYRFEYIHKVFPMLIYLQVTRQIHSVEGPLKAVNFTWGTSAAIQKITRSEVLDQIEEISDKGNHRPEDIAADLAIMNSLPSSLGLRIKRDLKVRPLVNLNFGDFAKRQYVRKDGHLPLIVINGGDIKVGNLKDYMFQRTRKPRSDRKMSEEPILRTLKVFSVRS